MPDHWPVTYGDELTLKVMRYAAQIPLGESVRAGMRVAIENHLGRQVARVSAQILAEELPPTTMDDTVPFTVPRFATWFDHFCATYRGRWWGWLLGLDKHKIRFIEDAWTHRTTVTVQDRWTYPRAEHIAPAHDFGHVVLKSSASVTDSGVMPW